MELLFRAPIFLNTNFLPNVEMEEDIESVNTYEGWYLLTTPISFSPILFQN